MKTDESLKNEFESLCKRLTDDRSVLATARDVSDGKKLYEALHPETRQGGGLRLLDCSKVGSNQPTEPYSIYLARESGLSRRTIELYNEIGARLVEDAYSKLSGTPLANSTTLLHTLARLPLEYQRDCLKLKVSQLEAALRDAKKNGKGTQPNEAAIPGKVTMPFDQRKSVVVAGRVLEIVVRMVGDQVEVTLTPAVRGKATSPAAPTIEPTPAETMRGVDEEVIRPVPEARRQVQDEVSAAQRPNGDQDQSPVTRPERSSDSSPGEALKPGALLAARPAPPQSGLPILRELSAESAMPCIALADAVTALRADPDSVRRLRRHMRRFSTHLLLHHGAVLARYGEGEDARWHVVSYDPIAKQRHVRIESDGSRIPVAPPDGVPDDCWLSAASDSSQDEALQDAAQ